MLKKVEKKSLKKSENIPSYKNFPKSEKVYVKGKIFKEIKVGMRKISLEDKEFKSFTVYDTSGFYSDPSYKHNYDNGLPKIKEKWIKRRNDTLECEKTELKYLDLGNSKVKTFPNVSKKVLKRKNNKEITQMYYARNK